MSLTIRIYTFHFAAATAASLMNTVILSSVISTSNHALFCWHAHTLRACPSLPGTTLVHVTTREGVPLPMCYLPAASVHCGLVAHFINSSSEAQAQPKLSTRAQLQDFVSLSPPSRVQAGAFGPNPALQITSRALKYCFMPQSAVARDSEQAVRWVLWLVSRCVIAAHG